MSAMQRYPARPAAVDTEIATESAYGNTYDWEQLNGLANHDLERELMGIVIADCSLPAHMASDHLARLRTALEPSDFDEPICRAAYEAMLQVASEGLTPDLTLLADEVERMATGVTMSDLWALTTHQDGTPSLTRFAELVRRQRTLSAHRRLTLLAWQAAQQASDRRADPGDLIARQMAELQQAQERFQRSVGGADDTVANVVSEYRQKIAEWRASPGALRGTTTGLAALDELTRGAHRGDLWVICGRMSMGKTASMLSMALGAVRNCSPGHQIGIVSLEMSKLALTHRLAAMLSGQSASGVEDGASWIDWDAVEEALDELSVLPIRIIDAGGAARRTNGSRGRMTVTEIARHARAWHQHERLDGLFVDYMELVTPRPEDAKEPRDVKLGSIAQGLKALAEELSVPVVLLAQANRETEKRLTHVPTLADIRGTDELAGVADVVLFPVVWDYYRVRGQELPAEVTNLPPGVVDLFIAKQRNRAAGKVRAFYLADRMQVVDYDERRQCPVDYHGNVIARVSYQGV